MSRKFFVVFYLVLAALFSAADAATIAKVIAVQGSPTASGPGGKRALVADGLIFEHDKITVGSGNAQILFSDGTKLVVGPGSSLVIEQYLMRGQNAAQNFSINALRGTFRFVTGDSAKKAYDIKTANATIGIRGTGFDFWVATNTGVAVLQGKVKLCNRTNRNSCVDINAGCEVGVTEPNSSKLLKGEARVQNITRKLPYVINQSGLDQTFQLNTKACRKYFAPRAETGQGNPDAGKPNKSNR